MKGHRLVLLGVCIFSSALQFGCMAGGPVGAIYTNMTSPGTLAHQTSYQVTPESDYESIAFVEGTAKGTTILGLVATGNFGFGAAIEDALAKAPGATRLIDITADTHVRNILGIFAEFTTIVRGRAVRIKKRFP